MKIALLCIYTGKYDIFWPDFFKTAEALFCPEQEKHYFVFTDSKHIMPSDQVTPIHQDNLGWPFNTLYRYRMFLRIKKQLLSFDKIVFLNGNCVFTAPIDFEMFFGINKSLIAALHPGFYNKPAHEHTYEKRPESTAYVATGKHYVAGGINGGNSSVFLNLCEHLAQNIETDLQNGLLALWHDESHWNAYINNHFEAIEESLHLLSPAFLYPEGWDLPFEKKILLRDKKKYGGHQSLRHGEPSAIQVTLLQRIKRKLNNIVKNL